ncbi:DUF1223 domain-containing protein [Ferrovibrio sp.]|uniref:DUF1223 domain-containing protein n=1 Tax=Ferrovibrio sp. TaxID=1917215 RepID=UPI003D2DF09C
MMRKLFGCLILALALGLPAALGLSSVPARADPPTPVVIEMFTSQGCASCPPADLMMQDWANDRQVIALSLHVDYWDYLGWRDTFAKRGHTDRQQAYAKYSGSRQVYTPQAVVNGQYIAVGSNREAVEAAVRSAMKDRQLALKAERDADGKPLRLAIPGRKEWEGEATIWLCLFDKRHDVTVQRGENSGKSLSYVNVARAWIDLGRWTGEAATLDLTPKLVSYDWDNRGAVVMVQAKKGQILGAINLGGK